MHADSRGRVTSSFARESLAGTIPVVTVNRMTTWSSPTESVAQPPEEGRSRWVMPDLVILDEVLGRAALQQFGKRFGPDAVVAKPERIVVEARPDSRLAAQAAALGLRRIDPGGARLLVHGDTSLEIVAGTDKHFDLLGAAGCLAQRLDPLEAAAALFAGQIWLLDPTLIDVRVIGAPRGVTDHDAALALLRAIGEPPPDALVRVHGGSVRLAEVLLDAGVPAVRRLPGTAPTDFDPVCIVDLAAVEPLVADPEAGIVPVRQIVGRPVHRAFIGSCAGVVEDLRHAAELLRGREVVVPTTITTGTTHAIAAIEGDVAEALTAARCQIGRAGCAACVNGLIDAFGEDTVIATAHPEDDQPGCFLTASIPTVVESAVAGEIRMPADHC
jgi:hypothetical protein